MITLHSLAYSRALRVVWFLDELGIKYDLKTYDRTEDFRAPDALGEVHPLGKSPVIADGELTLAESATIMRYIRSRYGEGTVLSPCRDSDAWWQHEQWLDYVESSLAGPVLAILLAKTGGEDPLDRMKDEAACHLDYISDALSTQPFLCGEGLTLADIQMSYLMALAEVAGLLEDRPTLTSYWQRLRDQPGFKKATAKAGPMTPPIGD